MRSSLTSIFAIMLLLLSSCEKGHDIVPDNDQPYYGEVPTIVLQAYINRIYIDLIGREPLEQELNADINHLRENALAESARKDIIQRLQLDSNSNPGDTTYRQVYFLRTHQLYKLQFVEGASPAEIETYHSQARTRYRRDSLAGNWVGAADALIEIQKMDRLISAEWEYKYDMIAIDQMANRMLDNTVYDQINMNSFNFINAAFNDLFHRYPTTQEYERSYDMVEYNISSTLFGLPATNKEEFIQLLVKTDEFWEGQIIFYYKTFLQREPTAAEIFSTLPGLTANKNVIELQRSLLASKEYAGF